MLTTAAVLGILALAMPLALAKGVGGLVIEGPGISGELTIVGDGTSASAERANVWVSGAGFAELAYGSDARRVTSSPPTDALGAEYRLTWIHMGPSGDFEVPALMYPFAEGGALVYMEPGAFFEEIEMTVTGGWFRSTEDLVALLEEYGAEMTPPTDTAAVQPALQSPAEPVEPLTGLGWTGSSLLVAMAGVGLVGGSIGLWATRRRPRRLEAS